MSGCYSGPSARRPLAELDAPGLGWQPKVDGCWSRLTTDATGRIVSVRSRTGADLPDGLVLVGLATGLPDAEIHGEIESHTEAALRARAARGWLACHLYDIARWRGCDVRSEPYATRYSLLHRWQAAAELGDVPRRDWWSTDDRGDHHDRAGRYARPVPADLRRLPVVQMYRGVGAGSRAWREHVEVSGGEGLVGIQLDAPMGAKLAKIKVKATDTLGCVVVSVDRAGAVLSWAGGLFAAPARKSVGPLAVGDRVDCEHDGYYAAGCMPRFARIVRRRDDLRRTA